MDPKTLEEVLAANKISQWDLLLVGDGSGSTWQREAGWSCISIEKTTYRRRLWFGAMNAGTVNFAEIMAYLQPLVWYVEQELEIRKKTKKVQVRNVHIITDSSYVRSRGDANQGIVTGKNGPLWEVFKRFAGQGIIIHWHWNRRDELALNHHADEVSKKVRKQIKAMNASQDEVLCRDLQALNPG